MNKPKSYCLHCRARVLGVPKQIKENYVVRGQEIAVVLNVYHCPTCSSPLPDPKGAPEGALVAYNEYRRINNLLLPDEIKSFRVSNGLTQKELAALLGWGDVTVSRYENGSLQDDAHDTALRLAMRIDALADLVKWKPQVFDSDERRSEINQMICSETFSFNGIFDFIEPLPASDVDVPEPVKQQQDAEVISFAKAYEEKRKRA